MFLSHFTLSFHFSVVLIVELDFSNPPAHKQPLFESKNLWSNVCYSDIEELLRYSTLYIKSFSTLRFNLFIRINYEIVFHQSVCFSWKLISSPWRISLRYDITTNVNTQKTCLLLCACILECMFALHIIYAWTPCILENRDSKRSSLVEKFMQSLPLQGCSV